MKILDAWFIAVVAIWVTGFGMSNADNCPGIESNGNEKKINYDGKTHGNCTYNISSGLNSDADGIIIYINVTNNNSTTKLHNKEYETASKGKPPYCLLYIKENPACKISEIKSEIQYTCTMHNFSWTEKIVLKFTTGNKDTGSFDVMHSLINCTERNRNKGTEMSTIPKSSTNSDAKPTVLTATTSDETNANSDVAASQSTTTIPESNQAPGLEDRNRNEGTEMTTTPKSSTNSDAEPAASTTTTSEPHQAPGLEDNKQNNIKDEPSTTAHTTTKNPNAASVNRCGKQITWMVLANTLVFSVRFL